MIDPDKKTVMAWNFEKDEENISPLFIDIKHEEGADISFIYRAPSKISLISS